MRTVEEMYELILKFAENDDRVRCVYLNGSRVDERYCDEYSDFDIIYIVNDIASFTGDDKWLDYFGKRLVMQKTSDWSGHPYDYDGYENYTYLMQYYDGNRIDLTLVDTRNIDYAVKHTDEPRKILLDKDGYNLPDIAYEGFYKIKKPTQRLFNENLNEFWWMCVVCAKGLCRNEITYVKGMMEHYQYARFFTMLRWLKGVRTDFKAEMTKYAKDIANFISDEEYEMFVKSFGNGDVQNIWDSLFARCDFFMKISQEVAEKLDFAINENGNDVISHIRKMRENFLK